MATVTLQKVLSFQGIQSRTITGTVTGSLYLVDQLGRVTVDTNDAASMYLEGWMPTVPGSGAGTSPTSGVATIDFGAFPGSPSATVTVVGADAADPNAVLDAWIVQVATVDHSADEHAVDPPLVSAVADGLGNVIISAAPSGRDLFVPPGIAPGGANSQQPIGQIQLMPVGKWSVGWAFAP